MQKFVQFSLISFQKTKRDLTHVSMLQATRQRVAELSAKVDDSITIRQAHEQEVSIEELSKQLVQIDAQKEKLAGELVVAERDREFSENR